MLRPDRFAIITAIVVLTLCAAAFTLGEPAAIAIAALCIAFGLATLPFSTLTTLLVILTAFSGAAYIIPVAGVNLRPETLLIPVVLVSVVVHGKVEKFFYWMTRPFSVWVLGFIVLSAVVTILNAPDVGASMNIVAWYLLNLVVLALALTAWGDNRAALYSRLKFCAALTVTTGLAGWLILQATGVEFLAVLDADSGARATGITFEPNILAGYAALWLYILITQPGRPSRGEWFLIAGCVAVIPLTGTRAAIVALVAGLAVVVLAMPRLIPRLIPIALLAGVGLIVIVSLYPTVVAETFARLTDFAFSNQTATFRYNVWDTAWIDISSNGNWIFGHGTNTYGQWHYLSTDPTKTTPGYLGNLPLQTLYDAGVVGVFFILGAALSLLKGSTGKGRARRFGALVTFTIIAIACNPMFLASFWLFAGLALAKDKSAEPAPVYGVKGDVRVKLS